MGVPVGPVAQLPLDAIVVNCSTSISPVAVTENLVRVGVRSILGINELIYASQGAISVPWFVRQQRKDIRQYFHSYSQLYEVLADDASRQTYLDVIRYRLTADQRYMQSYLVRLKDQYFEDFLGLCEEVFVDAGGFDGDTTEEFCRRYPDYRAVFLLEPSKIDIEAAKRRLTDVRNIAFIHLGLSDKEENLEFNSGAGPASSITEGAGESIQVAALDDVVEESVTFIKMDLKGWEMKALQGSAGHIDLSRPKLAIAVYHSAYDFRRIAEYVLSLNPHYKVYFRHYTQGWSETVMFFV